MAVLEGVVIQIAMTRKGGSSLIVDTVARLLCQFVRRLIFYDGSTPGGPNVRLTRLSQDGLSTTAGGFATVGTLSASYVLGG